MSLSLVVPLFSDSRSYVGRIPLQRRQWISLKNQTDTDFELIGVDNASHDDVLGLMQGYFPKAVAFRHEVPKNTVGARVAGVRRASCSHVVTLDSDCIVYPRFIEKWKAFITANPGVVGVAEFYAYWGPILSGSEFILEDPTGERIDYEKFERFFRHNEVNARPFYPAPRSFLESDRGDLRVEAYNWESGFYYSNASFLKETYLEAGAPDVGFTGYGHDDTIFGIRLQAMKTPVRYVRGMPAIHQNHRDRLSGRDRSHKEDTKDAVAHERLVKKLRKELLG
jgi:glycosyltransferase involved in cell wall biosynthesis